MLLKHAPWSTIGVSASPTRIRAQGLPPDYPTDIAYFDRYTRHELARSPAVLAHRTRSSKR
jgi:hypothetical protein